MIDIKNISLDLLEKYDVQGPRYTSYPPAPLWKQDMSPGAYEDLLIKSNQAPHPRPLSIYIHLPFCENLCLFCACTSIITGRNHKFESPYAVALLREMEWLAARVDRSRPIHQIHLGGGTPNYFSPSNLEKIISKLRTSFRIAPEAEIGAEIDPRTVTGAHLGALRDLGFNRLSFGIQDFDPHVQQKIRRVQPFPMIQDLVDRARGEGFASINFDLVYGLPGQTEKTFQKTVEEVLTLAPDRLAVYSYAYVPWMKKYQEKINDGQLSGREKFKLFLLALEGFTQAGYQYIGMDHFAKPNDELSWARVNGTLWRNFQGYTTKAGTDLLGLGLSAISQVAGGFAQNTRKLFTYQESLNRGVPVLAKGYFSNNDDFIRSRVIQRIMCQAGVDKHLVESEFGISFDEYFAVALQQLADLQEDGLVKLTPEEIRPTETGRVFLRNLAMAFDAYLPQKGEKQIYSRTV